MSTHNIHFKTNKISRIIPNNICSYGKKILGTQEQVRNSRGKRAIDVGAIEVSVYMAVL